MKRGPERGTTRCLPEYRFCYNGLIEVRWWRLLKIDCTYVLNTHTFYPDPDALQDNKVMSCGTQNPEKIWIASPSDLDAIPRIGLDTT
jgi:hypothetical protein